MMDVLLFHLTTTTTIGLLLCFFPMAVDIQRRTADGEKGRVRQALSNGRRKLVSVVV